MQSTLLFDLPFALNFMEEDFVFSMNLLSRSDKLFRNFSVMTENLDKIIEYASLEIPFSLCFIQLKFVKVLRTNQKITKLQLITAPTHQTIQRQRNKEELFLFFVSYFRPSTTITTTTNFIVIFACQWMYMDGERN